MTLLRVKYDFPYHVVYFSNLLRIKLIYIIYIFYINKQNAWHIYHLNNYLLSSNFLTIHKIIFRITWLKFPGNGYSFLFKWIAIGQKTVNHTSSIMLRGEMGSFRGWTESCIYLLFVNMARLIRETISPQSHTQFLFLCAAVSTPNRPMLSANCT